MRRLFTLSCALLLAGIFCLSQQEHVSAFWQSRDSNYNVAISTGGYVGPGDIVSGAKAWWGFRGYNAAYSGNVAGICDQSTGLVCVIATWSGSTLSIPNVGAGPCNQTTNICEVSELYDGSGSLSCGGAACNVTSAHGSRPTLLVSCNNGHPCMQCGTGISMIGAGTAPAVSQPLTVSFAAERTGGLSAFDTVLGSDASGNVQSGFGDGVGGANIALMYAGTVQTISGIADNSFHAMQDIYNGASSSAYIDGTSHSTSPGTNTFPASGVLQVCQGASFSNQLVGNFLEAGYWSGAFSGASQSSMNSNQHTVYWSF